MYMSRKVFGSPDQWKTGKYRKPLIIQEYHAVGRIYIIPEFGRTHYSHVVYFNFQTGERLSGVFAENISLSYMLPILSHISRQGITKGNTLNVFDKI